MGGIGSFINGIATNAAAGGDVRKGLAINAALLGGSKGVSAMAAPTTATGANISGTALSYGANNLGTAGTAASPSLLSHLNSGFQSANTWANQNPFLANVALQTAGSLLAPPPPPEMAPPPGLMRGQQFQMEEPTQYAMGSPRISLI
jgi:hypothetical protein